MIWFTSDLHIGHTNIIKYCNRPFGSVAEMNIALVTRWNERVSDSDTVYVIGDVFLGKPVDAAPFVSALKGQKVLVKGNHDRSARVMMEMGFDEVCNQMQIALTDGSRALLHHEPLPENRLKEYDILIHGHRHGPPRWDGKSLNVCVDLWEYAPISESDIIGIISGSIAVAQN